MRCGDVVALNGPACYVYLPILTNVRGQVDADLKATKARFLPIPFLFGQLGPLNRRIWSSSIPDSYLFRPFGTVRRVH
jgi:hypothetical protein